MIGLATRKKNFFSLDICTLPGKAMLSKKRAKPTYLLSKNSQIRLYYPQLEYASNTRVMKASKVIDGIDIIIKDGQQMQEKLFSSNSKDKNKDKNAELSPTCDTFFASATTPLNNVTSTSINLNDAVEQLCDF